MKLTPGQKVAYTHDNPIRAIHTSLLKTQVAFPETMGSLAI